MQTLAARSALLSLRRDRLSRRVDLYLALGGDYSSEAVPAPDAGTAGETPPR